ncbi:MAG TPA: hypothetical protein VF334_06120 [Polyangia bacterium]
MMKVRKKTRRARLRRDDHADAFLPDPDGGPVRTSDDLAEELAEEFLKSATSGDYVSEDELDREVPEESGGPFVIHPARYEFAQDVDDSNPIDGSREALPSPMRAR